MTRPKAKALLTAAGYPRGFDAGEFSCDAVYAGVIEGVVNDLAAVGIRAKVQPRERAAMQAAQREKRVKNLTRMGSGAPGNAATRVEAFMTSTGIQSFLKDPRDRSVVRAAVTRTRPHEADSVTPQDSTEGL